jgi:hypothetical protein
VGRYTNVIEVVKATEAMQEGGIVIFMTRMRIMVGMRMIVGMRIDWCSRIRMRRGGGKMARTEVFNSKST